MDLTIRAGGEDIPVRHDEAKRLAVAFAVERPERARGTAV
jgi:hypothetical protein